MIEISYLTEISEPYTNGLNKCSSRKELLEFVGDWKEIAYDAFEQVISNDFSWEEYQKMLQIERKGKYSGDEMAKKYGAILMPEIVLFIGLKAIQFHAPEGTVFTGLIYREKA